MALDDRSADPQSDSHPIALCRVERVEEAIGRLDTHTRIGNRQAHTAVIACRLDHDRPRPAVRAEHGIARVAQQVEDHLLQLHPVALCRWEIGRQLGSNCNAIPLKLARGESHDLTDRFVQIDALHRQRFLPEQRTQARDHLRSAVRVADRTARRLARPLDVRRIVGKHSERRARVRDDAGKRLVHFVRDRRGEGAERRDASDVRKLRPDLVERIFGPAPFGYVLDRADVFELSPLVSGGVSEGMDVLDRAVAHPQSRFCLKVLRFTRSAADPFIEQRQIVRMVATADQLECHARFRIEFKNAVGLLGPGHLSGRHSPQKLRFG